MEQTEKKTTSLENLEIPISARPIKNKEPNDNKQELDNQPTTL